MMFHCILSCVDKKMYIPAPPIEEVLLGMIFPTLILKKVYTNISTILKNTIVIFF